MNIEPKDDGSFHGWKKANLRNKNDLNDMPIQNLAIGR
jgi:hypothetical protein